MPRARIGTADQIVLSFKKHKGDYHKVAAEYGQATNTVMRRLWALGQRSRKLVSHKDKILMVRLWYADVPVRIIALVFEVSDTTVYHAIRNRGDLGEEFTKLD